MKSHKVTPKKASSKNKFWVPVFCVVIGIIVTLSVSKILASTSSDIIHGCVDNQGNLRVVTGSNTCDKKETMLDWNIKGLTGGSELPYTCQNCNWKQLPDDIGKLRGKNLSNAIMPGNLFGVETNLSSTDFSNADLSHSQCQGGCDFSNDNFTGANLSLVDLTGGSSITSSSDRNGNFQHANFTNTNLLGGKLDGGDFTGAIWSNTICPDNSNSNNNGNTCVGHLTP